MQSSTNTLDSESTPVPTKMENKSQEETSADLSSEVKKDAPKTKRKISFKRILKYGIFVMLIITLVATSGVFGYLYYKKYEEYQALTTEKARVEQALEDEKQKTAADYQAQIDEQEEEITSLTEDNETLTGEKETLEGEKTTLEDSVSSYLAKLAKIGKYINFLDYVYYVVGVHNGFNNLTDAEYQTARSKAQATGDSSLVSAVDSAWNDTEVDQMIRFLNVITTAQNGIKANL